MSMEQIITEEGRLTPYLEQHLENIGIKDAGLDYHMVSIIGAQSSGKSTLLNLLFGTEFLTMDEQSGRGQTTKGIHAALSKNSPLLVFDVEGSDSRERGDSDSLFERKAALFALTLSDILIINMWETDLGRFYAGNIPMLRTVFEVNVQLFLSQIQHKPKLLFVIRDFTSEPLDKFCLQLHADMVNIWNDIKLPPQFAGKSIDDFFDFQYASTRHRQLRRAEFDQDVDNLKRWFCDEAHPRYLFKDESQTTVPGDGLAQYITNLWDVIHNNKELNIPSQRSMLAHFKCEENMKIAYDNALAKLAPLEETLDRDKIYTTFHEDTQKVYDEAQQEYFEHSSRYSEEAVEEKKKILERELGEYIYKLYSRQLKLVIKEKINEFDQFLLSQGDKFVFGGEWSMAVQTKAQSLLEEINTISCELCVSPFKWTVDLETPKRDLNKKSSERREELVKELHDIVIEGRLKEFEEKAHVIMKKAEPDMWEKLRALIRTCTTETEEEIMSVLRTNAPTTKPDPFIIDKFQMKALALVEDSSRFILMKMKAAFDRSFKREPNGRPRVWTDDEDINTIYEDARVAGIKVLRLFQFSKLRDQDAPQVQNDPLGKLLIDTRAYNEAMDKFDKLGKRSYKEARSIIQAQQSKKQIPPWAWMLVILLGWDKILKLASNPFIFILVLFFGGGYFFLKQLGLAELVMDKIKEAVMHSLSQADENETPAKNRNEKTEELPETPIPLAQTARPRPRPKSVILSSDK